MKSVFLALAVILVSSCARRELLVVDGAGKPLSGVRASVLKGDGSVIVADTDDQGKAEFGTGKWTAINKWISIKLTYKGETIYDKVTEAPDSTRISIATGRQP